VRTAQLMRVWQTKRWWNLEYW